jgi:Zn ribbon nucleic-acid-binding protein
MPKQICPKCKSTDISKDFSVQSYGQGSFFNQYKCNKCGYTGQFFPSVTKKVKKKKKKVKKKK